MAKNKRIQGQKVSANHWGRRISPMVTLAILKVELSCLFILTDEGWKYNEGVCSFDTFRKRVLEEVHSFREAYMASRSWDLLQLRWDRGGFRILRRAYAEMHGYIRASKDACETRNFLLSEREEIMHNFSIFDLHQERSK